MAGGFYDIGALRIRTGFSVKGSIRVAIGDLQGYYSVGALIFGIGFVGSIL